MLATHQRFSRHRKCRSYSKRLITRRGCHETRTYYISCACCIAPLFDTAKNGRTTDHLWVLGGRAGRACVAERIEMEGEMKNNDEESRKMSEGSSPTRRNYSVWRFITELVVESPFMSWMFVGAIWLLLRNHGPRGVAKFFVFIAFLIFLSAAVPYCLKWIARRFPRISGWAVAALGLAGVLLLIMLFATAILDPSPPCNRFDDSGC